MMLHLYLEVEIVLMNMYHTKRYHIYSLLSQLNMVNRMDMEHFQVNIYLDGMGNIAFRSYHFCLVHFYNQFRIWDRMILYRGKYLVHIFAAIQILYLVNY